MGYSDSCSAPVIFGKNGSIGIFWFVKGFPVTKNALQAHQLPAIVFETRSSCRDSFSSFLVVFIEKRFSNAYSFGT